MLVHEIETAFEVVRSADLVSPALGENYRELEEVGRGSFGLAYQLGLQGAGPLDQPSEDGGAQIDRGAAKRRPPPRVGGEGNCESKAGGGRPGGSSARSVFQRK